jgi:C4-type Zn-finger protein
MALFKVVDGIRVEMSPEEEAQTRAEWAANLAKPRISEFDQRMADPMIKSIVQELAVSLAQTEQEVINRLKTRFETNSGR